MYKKLQADYLKNVVATVSFKILYLLHSILKLTEYSKLLEILPVSPYPKRTTQMENI
jgi:hypothetical protein